MIKLQESMMNVRNSSPLIHNITNYVTVNDCANILIACGAAPIMSDDINEVEDITTICAGLNINIGTMGYVVPAMFVAGKKANMLGHPVLLDPVGVGASQLRNTTAAKLLEEIHFSAIRGNMSEIKSLASGGETGRTRGVDTNVADVVTDDTVAEAVVFAKSFSAKTGAVIIISGAIDIIAFEDRACAIHNGTKLMSMVTGTGCQLSAMTTAYLSANKDNLFDAAVSSVCAMGVCGELAAERMSKLDGNSSYRNYIIDAIYNLSPDTLMRMAKITEC